MKATTPARISYWLLAAILVLVGVLRLGAPFLVIFFSYFALRGLLVVARNKWLALALFIVLAITLGSCAVYFTRAAIKALPEVAEQSIPSASAWAEAREIQLPFTDFESLKQFIVDSLKEESQHMRDVARVAGDTTTAVVFILIGIVIAISLFFSSELNVYPQPNAPPNNFYSALTNQIATRFRHFYHSFATVMGAQITISLINTLLTAIFVLVVRLPNGALVIVITFLAGLLPIVGNLISNTIIVALAFTISLKIAIVALVFLVAIHKLEYLLNSKIIGQRIRNPVWLTLIALVVGERLMGIPGMVLAPVVLNYLRLELSKVEVGAAAPAPH